MSILSAPPAQLPDFSDDRFTALHLEGDCRHYEESLSVNCIPYTVRALFCGEDYDDVMERLQKARLIINRFDNELDAHITQKRAELNAELCLLCQELDFD